MNYDLDMSALNEEITRVTTDKKPGATKKTGSILDKFVKMPKGDGYVTIRLLPPASGQKFPWVSCRVHNLGTAEKANNRYCGRVLKDRRWVGDCFFCDYYNYLYKEADKARASGDIKKADLLVAKAAFMKPQEKYYFNAIVRGSNPSTGQSEADGVLIYSCGVTIYNNILEACAGNKEMDKEPKGNVFHPVTGRDFKIVKKMKPGGKFPDYSGCEWKDVSILSKDKAKADEWLDKMNDLYALREVLSTDEMKRQIRIYEGIEKDPRNQFDSSFLEESSEVAHPKTSVSFSSVATPAATKPVNVPNVEDVADEPLVDDEFTRSVREALGSDD